MRKIQRLMAVCTFCFACAFALNCSTTSVSKVFGAISYYGAKNRNDGAIISAAGAVSEAAAAVALAGSGITLGGSIVVGLAISA